MNSRPPILRAVWPFVPDVLAFMWRRFWNFAVVLSSVLSVITVALWTRSYGRTDRLHVALFGDHAITSSGGRLYALVFDRTRDGVSPFNAVARIDDSFGGWEPLLVDRQWFGFVFVTGIDSAGSCRIVSVPHAAVAGMLAAPAGIVAVTRIRHRRRARRGCCTTCGYDLCATSDCCRECGTIPHEPPHNPPVRRTATASSGAVE